MEPVKLKTLFDLLVDGCTPAQLATAVEINGVHGWDRFGRFGTHKPSSSGAAQALDSLADYHHAEITFWQNIKDNPPQDDGDAAMRELPLDLFSEMPTCGIHKFGWPPDQVPEIDRLQRYPRPPRFAQDTANPNNLLRIIGALLEFIESRPKRYSQSQVIDTICGRHPEVHGLRESTLEKWFAAGNDALRKAKEKKAP